jgi:MOSC domain-containing protein YiiM
MITIQSIVYMPCNEEDYDRFGPYLRLPLEEARLITDYGLEGDHKAGHNPNRQLNLIPTDWLAERKAEGYRTGPGEMGEQIILDGIAMADMSPGLQLRLGDEAVIELIKTRTGCERLDESQPQPIPSEIKLAGIGYLAKIVQSGAIRVGDPVTVLLAEFA